MAGKFLAFVGIGKKATHIIVTRGGQFIFDAPDFLKYQVTLGRRFFGYLEHITLLKVFRRVNF
jgi:hypothetical protein